MWGVLKGGEAWVSSSCGHKAQAGGQEGASGGATEQQDTCGGKVKGVNHHPTSPLTTWPLAPLRLPFPAADFPRHALPIHYPSLPVLSTGALPQSPSSPPSHPRPLPPPSPSFPSPFPGAFPHPQGCPRPPECPGPHAACARHRAPAARAVPAAAAAAAVDESGHPAACTSAGRPLVRGGGVWGGVEGSSLSVQGSWYRVGVQGFVFKGRGLRWLESNPRLPAQAPEGHWLGDGVWGFGGGCGFGGWFRI